MEAERCDGRAGRYCVEDIVKRERVGGMFIVVCKIAELSLSGNGLKARVVVYFASCFRLQL